MLDEFNVPVFLAYVEQRFGNKGLLSSRELYSRAVEWGAIEQKGAVVRGGAGRAEKRSSSAERKKYRVEEAQKGKKEKNRGCTVGKKRISRWQG